MNKLNVRPLGGAVASRLLQFAFGASVRDNRVRNEEMRWPDFVKRLRTPKRGTETLAEYLAMPREAQDRLKDVGYFVAGRFAGERRRGDELVKRDAIALDFDHVPAGVDLPAVLRESDLRRHAWHAHITRKHRPEAPRWRMIAPLSRSIVREEHEPLARLVAAAVGIGWAGINWADTATFDWARAMHLPSMCADSQWLTASNDGAFLDPDDWLEASLKLVDWRDASIWPRSSRETERERGHVTKARKLGDPGDKPGMIGAFCRVYGINGAIEKYLPGAYLPGAHADRLTFCQGSTTNGAVLYDDGSYLYSHHESDPARGRCVNAFDLVRLHRFGKLDAGGAADTPMQNRPSYRAMVQLASEDAAVVVELTKRASEELADGAEPLEGGGALPQEITLLDFFAYLPNGQYIFAPTGEFWPARSVDKRLPMRAGGPTDSEGDEAEDPAATAADEAQETAKAKKKPPSASGWLSKHRRVEQATWAPGFPRAIHGRLISDGGWIERPGTTTFNLYKPAQTLAGDPDAAGLWLAHLRRIYEGESEHIVHWLAHKVQRPGSKINHALVLGGAQGIGKDSIVAPVVAAVGPWNFKDVSPAVIFGRFNGFVKSVILRISEAHDLGDVSRFDFYERLKTLIAAPPDVLHCDEKNLREHAVQNVCGVIITSNHKTDGIYLPADDRRHFVAWSDATKEDFPADYWIGFHRWLNGGGTGHVAAYLRAVDLSAFDPKAPPPKTAAFKSIVDFGQAPENAELADALDYLKWPPAVTLDAIARGARQSGNDGFASWTGDRRNSRQVPHRFAAAGYEPVRNDGAKDGLWSVAGRRQVIYAKSGLCVRDRVAAAAALAGPAREPADFEAA